MNIIYGDTDSIFISGVNDSDHNYHLAATAFTTGCKQNLGLDPK